VGRPVEGRLDPSYAVLASDAAWDVRTVGRAIAAIRELGLLRWQRRLVDGTRIKAPENTLLASLAAHLSPGST
jgi:hypothetical protein